MLSRNPWLLQKLFQRYYNTVLRDVVDMVFIGPCLEMLAQCS